MGMEKALVDKKCGIVISDNNLMQYLFSYRCMRP